MEKIKLAAIIGLVIFVASFSINGNITKPKVHPIRPMAGTNVYIAGFVGTGKTDITILNKH